MEGLVDYVKRQVKCPECRAEHRIPYNGIQGFPTNYTLTKFLELHAEITGEITGKDDIINNDKSLQANYRIQMQTPSCQDVGFAQRRPM